MTGSQYLLATDKHVSELHFVAAGSKPGAFFLLQWHKYPHPSPNVQSIALLFEHMERDT